MITIYKVSDFWLGNTMMVRAAYEMTRDEWEVELIRTARRRLYGKGSYGLTLAHREEVRAAILRGCVVPEAILALYPELKEVGMKAKLKLRTAEGAIAQPEGASAPAEVVATVPVVEVSFDGVDLHAYGARWQAGESITALARELGRCSWNRLWSELAKLGYRKAAVA
jgi:hypothetical protein